METIPTKGIKAFFEVKGRKIELIFQLKHVAWRFIYQQQYGFLGTKTRPVKGEISYYAMPTNETWLNGFISKAKSIGFFDFGNEMVKYEDVTRIDKEYFTYEGLVREEMNNGGD
jgi:hypothetical protein